jgi:hypothetical protein
MPQRTGEGLLNCGIRLSAPSTGWKGVGRQGMRNLEHLTRIFSPREMRIK